MSDSYRPTPWQVQPPDNVQRPMALQINVNLPVDANQADTGTLMQVAQGLVSGNASKIDQFLTNSRQQHSLSGNGYSDKSRTFDGVSARWRMNNGYETLGLEVYPSGGAVSPSSTSDTNLDGYIAWIFGEPGGPLGLTNAHQNADVTPWNLYMNGYTLTENFHPTLPCGGFVVLFGKTAMLEPSYVTTVEQLKLDGPTPLTGKVVPSPGWGKYTEGTSPTGQEQRAYDKIFGYWILDWTNVLNPCQYLQQGSSKSNVHDWSNIAGTQKFGPPQLTSGIYFPEVQKSPLKPRGVNNISAMLSPFSTWFAEGSETTTIQVFIAEFYDRGAYRTVSQSWTATAKPHRSVAANDRPMLFGGAAVSGAFTSGMDFQLDLSPATTKSFNGTNGGTAAPQMGPHDYIVSGSGGDAGVGGLDPDQQARYTAWVQKQLAASAKFNDKIAQQIAAWTDKWHTPANLKLLNEAQQMEYFYNSLTDSKGVRIPGPGAFGLTDAPDGSDRVWARDGSGNVLYGPVQQYLWNWDASFNNRSMPHIGRYDFSWGPANGGTTLLFDTAPNAPMTPGPNQTWANGGQWTTIDQFYAIAKNYVKTDANVQKEKELQDIITQKPPAVDTGPSLGNPITDFKNSQISIAGNLWQYDQNP